jgi:hypothetical protein
MVLAITRSKGPVSPSLNQHGVSYTKQGQYKTVVCRISQLFCTRISVVEKGKNIIEYAIEKLRN